MSASKFVARFSNRTAGPVDIEQDVEPEMRSFGIKDEIYYYGDEKLNPAILRGEIKHWEYPRSADSGDLARVADITYATQLEPEWQRMVCCKETLHLLDPMIGRVSSADAVEHLVKKIILPPELAAQTDGLPTLIDRHAVYYAAAILFPWGVREVLYPAYAAKKLPLGRIAKYLEIPLLPTAWVMSDIWPDLHKILLTE